MSLKTKRICKCCGKEYEYCPHCGSKSDEMWKNLTDTKECLAVFNIVAAYNVRRATAEQVKKVLKDNHITDYSSYNPAIVSVLDAVNKTSEKVIKKVAEETKVIEPLVDTAPHVVNMSEPTFSANVETKNITRKSRNGKKKHRKSNADIEL